MKKLKPWKTQWKRWKTSMITLGKSMNTMETGQNHGKIGEQCKCNILAPKFTKVQVFAPKCSKWQGKVPQTEKQPEKKTRRSPQSRMLTRMFMVQMSKHMEMHSQNTFMKQFIWTVLYIFPLLPYQCAVDGRIWKTLACKVCSVESGV